MVDVGVGVQRCFRQKKERGRKEREEPDHRGEERADTRPRCRDTHKRQDEAKISFIRELGRLASTINVPKPALTVPCFSLSTHIQSTKPRPTDARPT